MLLLFVVVLGVLTEKSRADYFEWSSEVGGNGHYYEVIKVVESINWVDAKDISENKTYLGLQGHLVAITSEAENHFVANTMNGIIDAGWAGGYQPLGSPEPDGNWQWITGESWEYSSWKTLEPNNNGDENALQIHSSDNAIWLEKWNDLSMYNIQNGYIVEYEVPEPATLLLITLGGLILRKRK